MGWISVKDILPEDNQTVIIYYGDIDVAIFERGISIEEREKMKRGEVEDPAEYVYSPREGVQKTNRSNLYRRADQWGNNKVPYCWVSNSELMEWLGQEVSHWMPLPEFPRDEYETK